MLICTKAILYIFKSNSFLYKKYLLKLARKYIFAKMSKQKKNKIDFGIC